MTGFSRRLVVDIMISVHQDSNELYLTIHRKDGCDHMRAHGKAVVDVSVSLLRRRYIC